MKSFRNIFIFCSDGTERFVSGFESSEYFVGRVRRVGFLVRLGFVRGVFGLCLRVEF